MKIKYTQLNDIEFKNLNNESVEPCKEGYHVFWWYKGCYGSEYIKYNLYFRGKDYGTSTIPNGKCEKDVMDEVTKDIEDGLYDY